MSDFNVCGTAYEICGKVHLRPYVNHTLYVFIWLKKMTVGPFKVFHIEKKIYPVVQALILGYRRTDTTCT
jgi:hypothetical protein